METSDKLEFEQMSDFLDKIGHFMFTEIFDKLGVDYKFYVVIASESDCGHGYVVTDKDTDDILSTLRQELEAMKKRVKQETPTSMH